LTSIIRKRGQEKNVTKFLNKTLRKFHRWLALPFIILIITLMFARGTPVGNVAQRVQQVMMLILAVSGAYLFLLPYLTKWQRQRRLTNKNKAAANQR
jgi:uncharacterized iron-regulated membrane protein